VVHDETLDARYPDQYRTIVSLALADGRTVQSRVDQAKGTPENPMTNDEVLAKYLTMAAAACGQARARAIADLVLRVDALDDVRLLGDAIRTLR